MEHDGAGYEEWSKEATERRAAAAAAATENAAPPPPPPVTGARRRRTPIVVACIATVVCAAAVIVGATVAARFDTYTAVSESMEPGISPGDSLLVRTSGVVDRGDVVVMTPPASANDDGTVVKRVVAIPGDQIASSDGHLVRNGKIVDEPYLGPRVVTENLTSQTVPAGTVFVMGDKRPISMDSRNYGAVPITDVEGRVVSSSLPSNRYTVYVAIGAGLIAAVAWVVVVRDRRRRT